MFHLSDLISQVVALVRSGRRSYLETLCPRSFRKGNGNEVLGRDCSTRSHDMLCVCVFNAVAVIKHRFDFSTIGPVCADIVANDKY